MKRILLRILWILVCLSPILFWYLIYKASQSEYDDNWAFFFIAVFVSIGTVISLLTLRKLDKQNYRNRKVIRLYSNILGTPIAILFIWIYIDFIQMNYKWSSVHVNEGKSYSDHKSRNIFKADNLIVLDDLTDSPDSISSVIKRNGEIEKLFKHENGRLIEISVSEIDYLTEKQKKALLEY
ncbi:hypothetical protein [Draconibacterium sediminis]|uniref:hypothetical protein n=1 Tax=Draconibacterium sediminis TaxID=1544798 RepID=UPI0026EB4343|nr:hypothetical protein [Draconibacterium sediminis]